MDIKHLKNTYFAMRHGKSQANDEELIVSAPERGMAGYGLTEEGKTRTKEEIIKAKTGGILDEHTIIVSSDFLRARETAEICAEVLGSGPIELTSKLRERSFGQYEGTPDANYERVWKKDNAQGIHDEETGIENVSDVLKRALGLIEDLEQKYEGKNIVLVSHGDTLQILLTAFSGISSFDHRSQVHLGTAEIRRCN